MCMYVHMCSTKEACHNQQHYAGDLLNIVAPEILNGLRPTTLSDIYGLTVALWEVLHGGCNMYNSLICRVKLVRINRQSK